MQATCPLPSSDDADLNSLAEEDESDGGSSLLDDGMQE